MFSELIDSKKPRVKRFHPWLFACCYTFIVERLFVIACGCPLCFLNNSNKDFELLYRKGQNAVQFAVWNRDIDDPISL